MKILRNMYSISMITKVNIMFLTFLTSVLLNRYLGPELKGEYSYVINYVNIIALVLTISITKALPYFIKKYDHQIEKLFVNLIYSLTLIYILLTLLIYIYSGNHILLLILTFSILSQFYQQINFVGLLKSFYWKNVINVIEIFSQVILLVCALGMDENKLDVVFYIFGLKLIIGIIFMVFKFKVYPSFNVRMDLKKIKEIMLFSIFPTVSTLLITLNYRLDIIILENYVSFYALGLYSLGVNLASMLWVIPDAFKDVLFNKTAKKDSIKDIVFSIKFNIYMSLIVLISFTIIGRYFIHLVYGREFIGAYIVTLILFLGNISMIFFKMINTLYIAIGNQRFTVIVLTLSVILNIITNIILIPVFGIEGAAIATIFSYTLCGMVFLISFSKKYNVPIASYFIIKKEEIGNMKKRFRR